MPRNDEELRMLRNDEELRGLSHRTKRHIEDKEHLGMGVCVAIF
jgi:hypothetical protein